MNMSHQSFISNMRALKHISLTTYQGQRQCCTYLAWMALLDLTERQKQQYQEFLNSEKITQADWSLLWASRGHLKSLSPLESYPHPLAALWVPGPYHDYGHVKVFEHMREQGLQLDALFRERPFYFFFPNRDTHVPQASHLWHPTALQSWVTRFEVLERLGFDVHRRGRKQRGILDVCMTQGKWDVFQALIYWKPTLMMMPCGQHGLIERMRMLLDKRLVRDLPYGHAILPDLHAFEERAKLQHLAKQVQPHTLPHERTLKPRM